MSKRKVYCNKKGHDTPEEAELMCNGVGWELYLCRRCKKWHVTSGVPGKVNKVKKDSSAYDHVDWLKRKQRNRRFNK